MNWYNLQRCIHLQQRAAADGSGWVILQPKGHPSASPGLCCITLLVVQWASMRSSMLHGSETWPLRKENVVAFQRAEMRMVRWMCGIKLKDRFPSKELRETIYRWHSIGITAEQAALIWVCAAKRRWRLGEEMLGVWSRGCKTMRKTKEDPERGCQRRLSSM